MTAAAPTRDRVGGDKRAEACAAVSARFGEPLTGTAGSTRAWLLVEHPGPWPVDALAQALGPDLLAEIERRAPAVRTVLIRRSARREVVRPLCVLISSAGAEPWMRQVRLDDYREILDLDLESLDAGVQPSSGDVRTAPLFTVCTHGRRDVCCAAFGRPVLRALAAEHDEVWECTHIGGDRFAANLLCFPHGLYYGHLDPTSALESARLYNEGKVRPSNLRGRSGVPASGQAAEHFVRIHTGADGIDDVVAGTPQEIDASMVRVPVATDGQTYDVVLEGRPVDAAITGGCGLRESVDRTSWSLHSLRPLDRRPSDCAQEVR